MRTLWLLRHAKSSWDDPAVADHERPLAPRGRKAAKRMRRWASEHRVQPEIVLCSSAVRARATLDLVLPALRSPQVEVESRLYHTSADALLERLRELRPRRRQRAPRRPQPRLPRPRLPPRAAGARRVPDGRARRAAPRDRRVAGDTPGVRPPAAARATALARVVARLRASRNVRPEMLVAGHPTPS